LYQTCRTSPPDISASSSSNAIILDIDTVSKLPLGELDGLPDGLALAELLGELLLEPLGLPDGDALLLLLTLGELDGEPLGDPDGLPLGLPDADIEGLSDSLELGDPEAEPDGELDADGLELAELLGLVEVEFDGLPDGEAELLPVSPYNPKENT
jgi:hypothetical protein